MKLPVIVYAKNVKGTDGSTWMECARADGELIEDNGPTLIGTYRLIAKRRLRKIVKEME